MFEEALVKHAPGGSNSPITIKFSLTTESHEAGDAVERQAADATAKVTAALDPLGSTPQAIGQLGLVVDTGKAIITEAQTFETTWGVLLKRMELFNKIVADIAAVFDVPRLVFHRLNAT